MFVFCVFVFVLCLGLFLFFPAEFWFVLGKKKTNCISVSYKVTSLQATKKNKENVFLVNASPSKNYQGLSKKARLKPIDTYDGVMMQVLQGNLLAKKHMKKNV